MIGPKFGMQPGPFKDLVESGKYKGSIVFGQLSKGTSGVYEGGERLGEGVQSLTDVTPYRIQELPENIVHDTTGAKYEYFDKYSNKMRRKSLSADMLKEPEFHDWMKSFSQNLKETAPEGAALPKGTQELLDAPTFAEGNAALERYLQGKYPGKYVNPKLRTIMPNEEGILHFTYGDGIPHKVKRSSIDDNLILGQIKLKN